MAELGPQPSVVLPYRTGGTGAVQTYKVESFRPLFQNQIDAPSLFRQLYGTSVRPIYREALNGNIPDAIYPTQFAGLPAYTKAPAVPVFRPTSIYGDEKVPRTAAFTASDSAASRQRFATASQDIHVTIPFSKETLGAIPEAIKDMYPDKERTFRPIQPIETFRPQASVFEGQEWGYARLFREAILNKFNGTPDIVSGSNLREANAVVIDVLPDARMETPWSPLGRPSDGLAWSPFNANKASSVILSGHSTHSSDPAMIIQLKRRGEGNGPVYNLVLKNDHFVYLPAYIVEQYEYRIPQDAATSQVETAIRNRLARAYADQIQTGDPRLVRSIVDAVLDLDHNIGRMLLQVTAYTSSDTSSGALLITNPSEAKDYIRAARRWRDATPAKATLSALFVDRTPLPQLSESAMAYRERVDGAPPGVWMAYIPNRVSERVCELLAKNLASLERPAHARSANEYMTWTDLTVYDIQNGWPELWNVMVKLAQDMTYFSGTPMTPQRMFQTIYGFVINRNRTDKVPGQEMMREETAPGSPSLFLSVGKRATVLAWEVQGQVRGQVMNQGDVIIMGPGFSNGIDLYLSNVDGYEPTLEKTLADPAYPRPPSNGALDLQDTTPVMERFGFLFRFGYSRFEQPLPGTVRKFPISFIPSRYTFLSAMEGGALPGRQVSEPSSPSSEDDFMDVSRILGGGGRALGGARGMGFRPLRTPPFRRPSFRPWRGYGRRRGYRRWLGPNPWLVYNSLNTWIFLLALEQSRLDAIRAAQDRRDAEEYWRQVVFAMQDYYRKFGRYPDDMNKYLPEDMVSRLRSSPPAMVPVPM